VLLQSIAEEEEEEEEEEGETTTAVISLRNNKPYHVSSAVYPFSMHRVGVEKPSEEEYNPPEGEPRRRGKESGYDPDRGASVETERDSDRVTGERRNL